MDGIREVKLHISLRILDFYIDDDPDYYFSFMDIGFKNQKFNVNRSLLSFRLDKGYLTMCYIDLLFFRIHLKKGQK